MAIAYDNQTVKIGQWASVACTEDLLPFVCKKLAYGTPTAATTTVSQGKFCKTMVLIRSYINDCFLHLRVVVFQSITSIIFRSMHKLRIAEHKPERSRMDEL